MDPSEELEIVQDDVRQRPELVGSFRPREEFGFYSKHNRQPFQEVREIDSSFAKMVLMLCREWIIKRQGWKPEDLSDTWHKSAGELRQT